MPLPPPPPPATFRFPQMGKMHSLLNVRHSQAISVKRQERTPMQSFRGDNVAKPAHPLEFKLLVVACLYLCFLPWALGTMYIWGQSIAFGLAVAAITLALWKRRYNADISPTGSAFTLVIWPRLLRFPIFWIGLGFLIYILIGALNPAFSYMRDERGWWMEPASPISWLPASVDAPFGDINPWRVLLIYSGIWLMACAVWIGITRRSVLVALLSVVVVNGSVLAVLGILQRVTEAKKILWLINIKPGLTPIATILYKNHGGAFFNLILVAACVLMVWHYLRASRRLKRTSPSPVFAFCAVLCGLLAFLSNSRAAALLLIGFILVFVIGAIIWGIAGKTEAPNRAVGVLIVVCFLVFIGVSAKYLNIESSLQRIERLFKQDNNMSVQSRVTATKATLDMAEDNLIYGTGAGSFRHMFPIYQRQYPEIYTIGNPKRPRYLRWEYAHNDYAQGLAELGIVGLLFPAAMLGYWGVSYVRNDIIRRIPMLVGVLGLVMTMIHSWVDFQMHNPAILGTWCLLWVIYGRWMELEPSE
ncbi:O-antigen ligase family protein [Geminisphaera colitermitum]|uniref:O-antigen ligase family protein n=1 Tax=Geminisphaera colitermitum TaxID=1148786 RepID=UPI001E62A94F|nr:O-antigen ligase family protein [Geminisphaera colitermitum]